MKRAGIAVAAVSFLAGMCCVGLLSAPAAATTTAALTMDTPVVTSGQASIAVRLDFAGDPGDTIDNIGLSVIGSSPALSAGGFARFIFDMGPNLVTRNWSELDPVADGLFPGIGLYLADTDPLNPTSPLTPSATPYALGTLRVDLSGLPGGQSYTVTLNGAVFPDNTDVGGFVGGVAVSYASEGLLFFGNPDGVEFQTLGSQGPIPEPITASTVFLAMGAVWGYLRRRRAA